MAAIETTGTASHRQSATSPEPGRPGIGRMLAPILRDVAIPTIAYFVLHWLGYSDFIALLAGAVVSAVMVGIPAIRARKIDAMAVLVLAVFVIGLVGSLISGDPRIMIIKDSFGTAVIGLAFLISAMLGKPLTYAAARKAVATSAPHRLPILVATYENDPDARRSYRNLAVLWGVGLLAEAILRVVLAYQLPIHTMAWLGSVLIVVTITTLMMISARTIKRVRKNAE
ncbi:MAG: hypothetical protein JWN03_2752 [Nocardia sp.]|uniref:VC0807 family protein n=1 Tax=Nocardia sp. TaxID=1821 RepID=UPI002622C9B2|nr:VC0807 family protein [Nocardia sp.]MCU1642477.1 hypothetical protein [Nocardia sp.]